MYFLAPSLPPADVKIRMLNMTTLRIGWRPPPPDGLNGILKGFQIIILGKVCQEIYDILEFKCFRGQNSTEILQLMNELDQSPCFIYNRE